MDLRRHIQVLWRFKAIVVGGVVVGVIMAILASFSVSFSGGPKLKWRSDQTYGSVSTLFVTQTGFPWGRVTLPDASLLPPGVDPTTGTTTDQSSTTTKDRREYAAPERFSDLAVVYAYLARSDQVRALMQPEAGPDQIVITPVQNPSTGAGLPLLLIETHAHSQERAQKINVASVEALRSYLREEQDSADIPDGARVRIQVLNPPTPAGVTEGRTYMGSLVALILAIAGAVALAYLLENLRASRRSSDDDTPGSVVHEHVNGNGNGAASEEFDPEEFWAEPAARARPMTR
jgi:hypothetical protein